MFNQILGLVENDRGQRKFESVYSKKVRAGRRRTYFFDVRRTKGDDFYLTLTESTKKFNGDGYERHKIFLYKEDFNRFLRSLEDVIDHVKDELMPDYDYDEFTRRQEEWESQKRDEDDEFFDEEPLPKTNHQKEDVSSAPVNENTEVGSEDDMSW